MSESIRLTTKKEHCPTCNDRFEQVARHWAALPDHRPDPDYLQQQVMIGLVLAGAKIDEQNETAAIDIRSRRLGYAVWLYNHLDWLSGDIYRQPRPESDRVPQYRLRTKSHPDIDELAAWLSGGSRPSVDDAGIGHLALRVWVARTAAVSFGKDGERRTQFHAEGDAKRRWYETILRHFGFDPWVGDRKLQLNQRESDRLFHTIGPPVPGMQHKWELDQTEYSKTKRDMWIEHEQLEYSGLFEGMLGRDPSATDSKYSERDALLALRRAANGKRLTADEYQEWRKSSKGGGGPSLTWFQDRAKWSVWTGLAGVWTGRAERDERGFELLLRAVTELQRQNGNWPSSYEYKNGRPKWAPSHHIIYQTDQTAADNWEDVIEKAKGKFGD